MKPVRLCKDCKKPEVKTGYYCNKCRNIRRDRWYEWKVYEKLILEENNQVPHGTKEHSNGKSILQ